MDGEDSDDDISLVSRSPSPRPKDAMDVDKYDEYVPGSVREVITVETKIKDSNKGFAMLAKLGWTEGQPLGLSGDGAFLLHILRVKNRALSCTGRVEPVPFYVKRDLTGLGKTNQDVRMIEETVSQRRELDSERQQKETEEQRLAREVCPKTKLYLSFPSSSSSRTLSPVVSPSSPRSVRPSVLSTATSATSSSKMSPSTTSTPTPMPTIIKCASATCRWLSGRSKTQRRSSIGERRRNGSGRRRSCAR